VLGGLAYGLLLAWLASAASGYGSDSRSLSLVLLFMAGFPVSLPLSGFGGYFMALGPPLLWAAFGGVAAFSAPAGRARTVGGRLLALHYIGVLIGLLAVPWAVDSSLHVSAKSLTAVLLWIFLYATGQMAWWRALGALDRRADGSPLPRLALGSPQLGRLAAGVLALLAAAVILGERGTLTITCRRASGECDVERAGWRAMKRRVPLADVSVRLAVPRSRLEVATGSGSETLIAVECDDRRPGVSMLERCESRGARMLAPMQAFLDRRGGPEVRVVDDDPWPPRAVAAALAILGLWLFVSALVTVAHPPAAPPRYAPVTRPRRSV